MDFIHLGFLFILCHYKLMSHKWNNELPKICLLPDLKLPIYLVTFVFFRFHGDKIMMHFADVGRKPPTFSEAAMVANAVLNSGFEFDFCELYYNVFK